MLFLISIFLILLISLSSCKRSSSVNFGRLLRATRDLYSFTASLYILKAYFSLISSLLYFKALIIWAIYHSLLMFYVILTDIQIRFKDTLLPLIIVFSGLKK